RCGGGAGTGTRPPRHRLLRRADGAVVQIVEVLPVVLAVLGLVVGVPIVRLVRLVRLVCGVLVRGVLVRGVLVSEFRVRVVVSAVLHRVRLAVLAGLVAFVRVVVDLVLVGVLVGEFVVAVVVVRMPLIGVLLIGVLLARRRIRRLLDSCRERVEPGARRIDRRCPDGPIGRAHV